MALKLGFFLFSELFVPLSCQLLRGFVRRLGLGFLLPLRTIRLAICFTFSQLNKVKEEQCESSLETVDGVSQILLLANLAEVHSRVLSVSMA